MCGDQDLQSEEVKPNIFKDLSLKNHIVDIQLA